MTVVLVDDHPILMIGLSQGLALRSIDVTCVEPRSAAEVLDHVLTEKPELVVMDYAMPGVESTAHLVAAIVELGCRVMMLSGSDDRIALAQCLQAGAEAVVSKDESVQGILDEICDANAGQPIRPSYRVAQLAELRAYASEQQARRAGLLALTPREREVLDLMLEGMNAQNIASAQVVSIATIRTQIKAILTKLGVTSQLEAVAMVYRLGY